MPPLGVLLGAGARDQSRIDELLRSGAVIVLGLNAQSVRYWLSGALIEGEQQSLTRLRPLQRASSAYPPRGGFGADGIVLDSEESFRRRATDAVHS